MGSLFLQKRKFLPTRPFLSLPRQGHLLAAREGFDVLHPPKAQGTPVVINSYLANGFKAELAEYFPAGIAVEVAVVALAAAFWVADPKQAVGGELGGKGSDSGVELSLDLHKGHCKIEGTAAKGIAAVLAVGS